MTESNTKTSFLNPKQIAAYAAIIIIIAGAFGVVSQNQVSVSLNQISELTDQLDQLERNITSLQNQLDQPVGSTLSASRKTASFVVSFATNSGVPAATLVVQSGVNGSMIKLGSSATNYTYVAEKAVNAAAAINGSIYFCEGNYAGMTIPDIPLGVSVTIDSGAYGYTLSAVYGTLTDYSGSVFYTDGQTDEAPYSYLIYPKTVGATTTYYAKAANGSISWSSSVGIAGILNNTIQALPLTGGEIYIKRTSGAPYPMEGTVLIDRSVYLHGDSAYGLNAGAGLTTSLKLNANVNADMFLIRPDHTTANTEISYLFLDGNGANQASGTGININVIQGTAINTPIEFKYVLSTSAKTYGFAVVGNYDVWFDGVVAENNLGSGIYLYAGVRYWITNSIMANNGVYGLTATDLNYLHFSDNQVLNNAKDGVILNGVSPATLIGNQIWNNGAGNQYSGVSLTGSSSAVTVTGNIFGNLEVKTNNQKYGLSIGSSGVNRVSITGNVFKFNTVEGFYIANQTLLQTNNITLSGNEGVSSDYQFDESNFTPTGGLSCYYPLDASSGTSVADYSGYGNTATTNGGWGAGKYGNAADLDGATHYINITSPTFFNSTVGTITGWFKTDNASANQVLFAATTNGLTQDEFIFDFLGAGNKNIQIIFNVDGAVSASFVTANNIITDTNWHFISLKSTGSTLSLKIDAVAVSLAAGTGTNSGQWFATATNADIFVVGSAMRNVLLQPFDGLIDDFRIYNRALSVIEETAVYNCGPIPHYTP